MKGALIFLCFLILGPILGCLVSGFWYSGANTFWKPIDYFPFAVNKLIAMKPFGKEFWVETSENEIYKVAYPCLDGQTCWEKSADIPSDLAEGNTISYKTSNNRCENDNFVYPLHAIRTCITLVVPGESPWTTSLALTDNNKLWIWDKSWKSPYTELVGMVSSMFLGGMIGFLAGALFLGFQKIKENKYHALPRL